VTVAVSPWSRMAGFKLELSGFGVSVSAAATMAVLSAADTAWAWSSVPVIVRATTTNRRFIPLREELRGQPTYTLGVVRQSWQDAIAAVR
jgi:hypothetical protein